MKNFSFDIELIIQCCQYNTNTDKIQSLISKITNWETFIDLAFTHGVFPLVYKELKQHSSLIPQKVLNIMKSHNMDIIKENMLMSAELIKVMKLLEENNIEALAFKGPTLAQMAYGDITLRQYGDLDILINSIHIQQAYSILNEAYSTNIKKDFISNLFFIDKSSDIQFFHKKNNILLELHWQLFREQFFNININKELYKRKQKILLFNKEIYTFSNELLIIYLCIHGSKHTWERISWILDITMIIHKYKLDWQYILNKTKEIHCQKMLFLGLELSNQLFHISIPIKFKKKSFLCNYITRSFQMILNEDNEIQNNINNFKFHYYLQDSVLLKIQFLIKSLFSITDRDILELNLTKKFIFLYIPIKFNRLIKKYIFQKTK